MPVEPIRVHSVAEDEFTILTARLEKWNRRPDWQCLHTWSGQSIKERTEQLLRDWESQELCYLVASEGDTWVGAIGAEYDIELGRCWIHGPSAPAGEWERVAPQLYPRLLAALPSAISRYDVYLHIENQRARSFFAERDFHERSSPSNEFSLEPESRTKSKTQSCDPLPPLASESFKALFSQEFPKAYYSPERILQMDGISHRIFSICEAEIVLGFVVLSLNQGSQTGEIQFLAVHEDHRRKGYGQRLLRTGVDWLFDREGKLEVTLNVDEERTGARALYESLGFKIQFTGIGMTKEDLDQRTA
jgi:ribosomal protein S18 acetylase RimI-like enzyme